MMGSSVIDIFNSDVFQETDGLLEFGDVSLKCSTDFHKRIILSHFVELEVSFSDHARNFFWEKIIK
jgi:hypothetical protein